MARERSQPVWKKILDLCDKLAEIHARLEDGEDPPSLRRRFQVLMRRTGLEIQRRVAREARSGVLAPATAQIALPAEAHAVLALLLARSVSADCPEIEWREILDLLFQGSFAKLQGVPLLRSEGTLRFSGLVEVEIPGKGSDPLDARFRLSDRVLKLFCDAGIAPPLRTKFPAQRTYRNQREYLLDLKSLKALHQQRASRVFDPERIPFGAAARADVNLIEKKIRFLRRRIEETVEATPNCLRFTAVRFRRELGLSEEEMLIVVALLFQELLEGEAYADAVELLKMVSCDEEDLIRNRQLLRTGAPLLRNQIVQLEDMVADKEMTAEVSLSNWVVERLLAEERADRAIAPDEKIDFHNYLKNLDSAETFIEDLKRENP